MADSGRVTDFAHRPQKPSNPTALGAITPNGEPAPETAGKRARSQGDNTEPRTGARAEAPDDLDRDGACRVVPAGQAVDEGALRRIAWAAARRAIGTRNGEQET